MDHASDLTDPIAGLRVALERRYEIGESLGQGAFATVYRAVDIRHGREVAIKVLNVDPNSEESERRFLREIRLLAALQHPNILPLYDSGYVGNVLYYVMPYVRGQTLREQIKRERRLSTAVAVSYAREIADALYCAHQSGVVHRDIKPENILVSNKHAMIADFGVAMVRSSIGPAARERLTKQGLGGPGTPAYMSPEQLIGDNDVDARSDIYSLGCLLFEMLGGAAPFAGKDGFTRRFTESPPSIRAVRPDAPELLDDVIQRSLQRDPASRFPDARLMAEELRRVEAVHDSSSARGKTQSDPAPITAVADLPNVAGALPTHDGLSDEGTTDLAIEPYRQGVPPHLYFGRRLLIAVACVLVVAVAGFVLLSKRVRANAPPVRRYVVLPFVSAGGRSSPLSGAQAALMLNDAISHWRDIPLVGSLRVADLISRRGSPPKTLSEAAAIARDLSATMFIWGSLSPVGDSIETRAGLYATDNAQEGGHEYAVQLATTLANARDKMALLADSLVVSETVSELPVGSAEARAALATTSLAAWTAYLRGVQALDAWDLHAAEGELRVALNIDPNYAHAALALSQVMAFDESGYQHREEWWRDALRAWNARSQLSSQESAHALSLTLLAQARYPEACAEYRRAILRDSLDFIAWYGLGECNARDPMVVSDRRSPSGWAFRGSYEQAVKAYRTALILVPSVHAAFRGGAIARLQGLLFTDDHHFRAGVSSDSTRFVSFPGLSHDTIAFVPYTREDARAGRRGVTPPTLAAAIDRDRQVLRSIATSWVTAFPRSADAHEVLANALESTSEIDSPSESSTSALSELRLARQLATDTTQQLRLEESNVRLLLKRQDFSGAELLADSLLARRDVPSDPNESWLDYELAILTGRLNRARQLAPMIARNYWVVLPGGKRFQLPQSLASMSLVLDAFASTGARADSLVALRAAVMHLVSSDVPPDARSAVQAQILARAMAFAFPVLGRPAMGLTDTVGDRTAAMEQQIVAQRYGEVRSRLSAIDSARATARPGSASIDAVYLESVLYESTGDSTGAAAHIDNSLNHLANLPENFFELQWNPGALVRAFALRAELAAAHGEAAEARRWAGAVATLWVNADPALAQTTARMQQILSAVR